MTDLLGCTVEVQLGNLPNGTSFYIPADQAERAAIAVGMDVTQYLAALLSLAPQFSRPAISKFPVGALAMGIPKTRLGFGNIYFGASFEVLGEVLTVVVHGEQSAIQNAWSHGETAIKYLAINAAPCGYCRQFLWEVSPQPVEMQILLTIDGDPANFNLYPLPELLPVAFGPAELKKTRSLLIPQTNHITTTSTDPLVIAAIAAADTSYAPYTATYAGVAIQTSQGQVTTGRYAENAAYNPSMSPMMGALSQLNLSMSPAAPLDLARVVLAVKPSGVNMRAECEAIVAALAPNVTLEVIELN
jgi:cytidine deaminase